MQVENADAVYAIASNIIRKGEDIVDKKTGEVRGKALVDQVS